MAQQIVPNVAAAEDLPADAPEHIRRLARALADAFPQSIFDAEPMDYNVGWSLAIVSEHFNGLEDIEPGLLAWEVAKQVLTPEECYASSIWALSATEFQEMQDAEAAES